MDNVSVSSDVVTRAEAAVLTGLSPNTIQKWITKKLIASCGVRKQNYSTGKWHGSKTIKLYNRGDVLRVAEEMKSNLHALADSVRGTREGSTGHKGRVVRDGDNETMEELEAKIAERMKTLPKWWHKESCEHGKGRLKLKDVSPMIMKVIIARRYGCELSFSGRKLLGSG